MTRQNQIAEAAFVLFSERGYAHVRMEDVARHAGVAKGTVYLYFAGKEGLFRAVIERKLAPVTEALEHLTAEGAPVGEPALRQFYEGLATLVDSGVAGTVLRMVISESVRFPEVAEIYHRTVIAPAADRLAALLDSGAANGVLRPAPVRDYPVLLVAPALMAALWRLMFERMAPLDTSRFLDAFADLAIDGLKPQGENR